MLNIPNGLIEWVLTQKRVTIKRLRDRFDLTEEEADKIYYNFLRPIGIFTTMGHVNPEWNDNDLVCLEKVYGAWRAFRASEAGDTIAYFDTLEDAIRDIRARGYRECYEVVQEEEE